MLLTNSISETLQALSLYPRNPAVCTGLEFFGGLRGLLSVVPITGQEIAETGLASERDYEAVITTAIVALDKWRRIPAPQRHEVVRAIGQRFREMKEPLGTLISIEAGKSLQEGKDEIQQIIDHELSESLRPRGMVAVITNADFPVGDWARNAMSALICGDTVIWKPSEKAPLSAVACFTILKNVFREYKVPEGTLSYLIGGADLGALLSADPRIVLI